MRIAHLTDLHVQRSPGLGELVGKRLIGTANLYLGGRRAHFSARAQQAAVEAAIEARPDLPVITGDLTAQGLESEFAAARVLLAPLLESTPAVIIAGNHDTYVREPAPAARMRATFGRWMGERSPWLHRFDGVEILCIETCRAHLLSSGHTPGGELAAAANLLDEAGGSPVLLAQHYPLRGRDGAPYGPWTRALADAASVEALLARTAKISAVLHGHEHHGFRTTVPSAAGPIPILNPGASGYAWLPDRGRTAHLNLYEVEAGGLSSLRRLRFDGERFDDEPGGPYASGR